MTDPRRTRRILVLLDASPESLSAAEATAELAATLGAELVGLFVEDLELTALAQHPLARQMDWFTRTLRPVEGPELERRLRAQAARARKRLARTAGARGVAWSFRVQRGAVLEQVEIAATEVDLVTVGRIGWSRARKRLGSTARALLGAGPGRVLIQGRRAPADAPVIACYDGSPSSGSALEAAAELALQRRSPLRVAIFAPDDEVARGHESEVRSSLAGRDIELRFSRHASDGPELIEALREGPCAVLVLPADGPVATEDLEALVVAFEGPLLIVR